MVRKRHEKQVKIATSKGYHSRDIFKIGDSVVLRDHVDKKWKIRGKVEESRLADAGTVQSFLVRTESGGLLLRHKSHLRHDTRASDAKGPKKVRFSLESGSERGISQKEKGTVTRRRSPRLHKN